MNPAPIATLAAWNYIATGDPVVLLGDSGTQTWSEVSAIEGGWCGRVRTCPGRLPGVGAVRSRMNKQAGDVLPPGSSSLRSGRLNPADYYSTREVLDLWNIAEPDRGAVRRELQRKCLTSRIASAKKTEGRGDWRIPRAWAEDQANRLETLKNLKERLADEGAHEIDLREGSAESSAADDAMFELRMQVVVLERRRGPHDSAAR